MVSHVCIFKPSCEQAPSDLFTGTPPPPPSFCDYVQGYEFIQCVTGRGDRVVWRPYTGVIHCVFDQIPNLQNCFTTTNKKLEGEGASYR